MRTRRYFHLILLWVFILTAGCQTNLGTEASPQENTPNPGEPSLSTPPAVPTTQGETMTSTDTSGMESMIEMAKNDLARRLYIPIDEIHLVEARPVVWPDSSLGCPQPGMAYLQVPEDGALIVLQVGNISYKYHNGGNRGLFLCETVSKDPAITPNLDLFNLTPSKSDPPPTTPDNSIPPGEDT